MLADDTDTNPDTGIVDGCQACRLADDEAAARAEARRKANEVRENRIQFAAEDLAEEFFGFAFEEGHNFMGWDFASTHPDDRPRVHLFAEARNGSGLTLEEIGTEVADNLAEEAGFELLPYAPEFDADDLDAATEAAARMVAPKIGIKFEQITAEELATIREEVKIEALQLAEWGAFAWARENFDKVIGRSQVLFVTADGSETIGTAADLIAAVRGGAVVEMVTTVTSLAGTVRIV